MRKKVILIILAITVILSFSIISVANSKKTFGLSELTKYANVYIKYENEKTAKYNLSVATNSKGQEINWGQVKLRADIYEAMGEFSNKTKKEIYSLAYEKIKSEFEEENLLLYSGQQVTADEVRERINNIKEILKSVPENDNQIKIFLRLTNIDEDYYWSVIKFDEEYRYLTHLKATKLQDEMRISNSFSDSGYRLNANFMELTNEK